MASSHSLQSETRGASSRARIMPLAVLPVFFNLRGKPVLVIGGQAPAVWKAELLAQCGATVLILSPDISDEMEALAGRTDLHGSVVQQWREWSLADFAGKVLVVADAATDGEAKAIVCAARAAGLPVNVIDRPEFCSFQFGSIVNRSPVVIGISTDGAAPVLGQSIRTRIEAVLPQSLANWASFAKDIRATVLRRFKPGAERRQFWAKFASKAFGPFTQETAWVHGAPVAPSSGAGQVHVLYVNPDDQGELTLNAVGMLQSADVIVHDSCVSGAILDHARREAERTSVCASDSAPFDAAAISDEINAYRRDNKTVVLLAPANADRRVWSALAEGSLPGHETGPANAENILPAITSLQVEQRI
ncbi:MAG: NAD(P)-dependent oxidoreductase [Rhizobiaceae bacterium]